MEYFPKGLLSQAHCLNLNGHHELYLYNEAGMRIYKQSGGIGVPGESFYLISAGGVMYSIEETQFHSNGNGNSTIERYNIPDLGYEDQHKEINYQIQDHLGNLRLSYTVLHCPSCSELNCASVDVQYQINYIAEYLAYGGLLREFVRNGTAGEKFLSTGHERDKQTSWDYRQARYYDADLGRFLAVDLLASYAPAWSPYRYAFDNPISITDPTGLFENPVNFDTKGDMREWAKANGHRIGWFSQYKFEKSESGGWDIVDRKASTIYKKARTEEEKLYSTANKHGVFSESLTFELSSLGSAQTQSKGERLLNATSNIILGVSLLAQSTELPADIHMATRTFDYFNAPRFTLHPSAINTADKAPISANRLMSGSQLVNVAKNAKGIGIAGNIVGGSISLYKIFSGNGQPIDYVYLAVNGAGIYAAVFLASNPVGWVIGGATIVYGGVRLYQGLSNK